jgi:hypothetical protein
MLILSLRFPEVPEEIYLNPDSPLRYIRRSLQRRPSALSQNAQRPFPHQLGLCRGFVEPRLEVRASMFPRHLDGGSHIVCQDDELRRAAVVMAAKADDVDLSHSGRENSEKIRGEQGGAGFTSRAIGYAVLWARCLSAMR